MHSTRRHVNVLNVLVLLDLLEYCVRSSVAQLAYVVRVDNRASITLSLRGAR